MAAILSLPPWAITSTTQLYNGNQQSRSCQRAFSISQKASDRKTLQSLEGNRARLNIKSFPGMGIRDCLIFNMGIPILARRHLYIETVPWSVVMILPIALKCGRRLGSTAAEAPVRPTSKRYLHFNTQSRGFEVLWDLTIRCPTVRSYKDSNTRDRWLESSNRCDIWHAASRQYCYRGAYVYWFQSATGFVTPSPLVTQTLPMFSPSLRMHNDVSG